MQSSESEPANRATGGTTSSRIVELDALRAIAAAIVVLFHFTDMYETYGGGFRAQPSFCVAWGHWGVPLFFMVSGFVIMMTTERKSRPKEFCVARFARLFPAYWASVVLAYAIGLFGVQPVSLYAAAINLTMVQEAFAVSNVCSVYWTLYVELLFYAIVAVFLAMQARRWIPWCLLGVLVADTLATFPEAWDRVPGWWRFSLWFPLLRQLHLFIFGMWVYRDVSGKDRLWLPIAGLCLLNRVGHGADLAESSIVVGIGALFALAVQGKLTILKWPPLIWLGGISYSLYLVHMNLGFVVIRWCQDAGFSGNASIAIAIAVCVVVAWCFHRVFELWCNRAILDWWGARQQSLPAELTLARSGG